MITRDVFVDAYINLNILLVLTCLGWMAFRAATRSLTFRNAHTTQLQLLQSLTICVLLSPFIIAIVAYFNIKTSAVSLNVSDFVVSQYLKGNFEMNPSLLQEILGFRAWLTTEIVELSSQTTQLVLLLLAAVSAALFLRIGVSTFKLHQVIKNSYTWRKFGNVNLLVSDTIHVPFSTRTLRQRYIVIPSELLTQSLDLKIALSHEFQHLRQRDVEWEIASEFLRPLFFWNPAFYILKHQIEELRELSCDQQVLVRRRFDVAAYCECLLRVCSRRFTARRMFFLAAPQVALVQTANSFFGQSSARLLRNRILSMVDGGAKQHSRRIVGLMIAPIVIATLLICVAIQKPDDWSHDRLMLSTIINLDRLEQRNAISLATYRPY